jgi:polyhydroxyalkanoate synthase
VAPRQGRLLRYASDKKTRRTPLLIVFSNISRAYIMDLRSGHSFIERFLDTGFDIFMVDWGEPDAVDAGNDLELYVDNTAASAAICAIMSGVVPEWNRRRRCRTR